LELAKTDSRLDVIGKKVAVIGGGNTAMDVAVTAQQLGAEDVYVIYRRSFTEMPAWSAERDRAFEAGVHFIILTQHLEYLSDNGKVVGVKVCPCQLTEPDESGRRRAVAVEKSSYTLDFDIIAEAIGQKSIDGLDVMLPGVELKRGRVVVNDNCQTSIEKVFAGGDIVRGASSVVAAVADGMKAARQIDLLLKCNQ
jgi:glutamate synthase (NADPH/NADH) small chain